MKLHTLIIEADNSVGLSAVISYIDKKLGIKLVKMPVVEHFKNSTETGWGIRYVESGTTRCVRFNWSSEGQVGKISSLMSIDIFMGNSRDPNFTVHLKDISLIQAMPVVIEIFAKPKTGEVITFPANPTQALTEDFSKIISEVSRDAFTQLGALDNFLEQLQDPRNADGITRSDFVRMYHIDKVGIFDTVVTYFRDVFDINGKRVSLDVDSVDIPSLREKIIAKAGLVIIDRGGNGEIQLAAADEDGIPDEKVSFGETLEHLETLTTSLVAGAFNALFVIGRGGTGKTQTVEAALEAAGLSDGDGFFKNTGSASASGIYSLLYHHKDDIILFDDSDSALKDQESRNLIKAATDTKKRRKLVWNKKSSFIFDPDSEDPEAFADDVTMAPKYFDFTGRIIFISNLTLQQLDPDGALRTRAMIININPSDEELIEHMFNILDKVKLEDGLYLSKEKRLEVFEIVKKSKRKSDVSLRKLVRSLNIAATGVPGWERIVSLYA